MVNITGICNNSLKPLKQINSDNRLDPIKSVYVRNSFLEDKIVYLEIESIKNYLIEIIKSPIYQNKTIGVVSLGLVKHTEKLKDLKEDLSEIFGRDKLDEIKLIIEDSPKFQGDERDVMLVSLGVALDSEKIKSNDNPKPRAIVDDGKLKDDFKKINVAFSRAKEQMILFHSVKSENLRNNDFRLKILSFFNNETQKLVAFDLPENETDRNLYNIPKPFDSWFEYDITSDLIDKGYKYIQPQYKVKEDETFYNHHLQKETYVNFKLDLVVLNNGKMVAIECDGDPFHSLPEDVAYDVERQEFLERVGWKVHRLLYSAYRRNKSAEIDKIINFIVANTKKVKTIALSEIKEYEPFEEVNKTAKSSNHLSFIDELDEELEIDNAEIILKNIGEVQEDRVLCYFNLNKDSTYCLGNNSNPNSTFSIEIKDNDKDGYLLQGYDNGHLNKVFILTLLSKRIEREYKNGLNTQANLIFLKIIKKEEIIGINFIENGERKFKAHLTENISSREQLHLQGYKVIYNAFEKIEYKILPLDILNDINRLVFQSFTANGKPIDNNYYDQEWSVIRQFFPNNVEIANKIETKITAINKNETSYTLFDAKVELQNIVKIKYLNNDKVLTVQLVDYQPQKMELLNGVQKIYIKTPLANSILGKFIGDKVKVGNTESYVEILKID